MARTASRSAASGAFEEVQIHVRDTVLAADQLLACWGQENTVQAGPVDKDKLAEGEVCSIGFKKECVPEGGECADVQALFALPGASFGVQQCEAVNGEYRGLMWVACNGESNDVPESFCWDLDRMIGTCEEFQQTLAKLYVDVQEELTVTIQAYEGLVNSTACEEAAKERARLRTTTTVTTTSTPVECTDASCGTAHGCTCLMTWFHKGEEIQGCAGTGKDGPWCQVYKPEECEDLPKTDDGASDVWDYCGTSTTTSTTEEPCIGANCKTDLSCTCKKSWTYKGMDMDGCSWSEDKEKPWCFISAADKERCKKLGGQELDGEIWDTCPLGELTDHSCHCRLEWSHQDEPHKNCARTKDHDTAWCIVADGPFCDGAKKADEFKGGDLEASVYWDTCGAEEACDAESCMTTHDCWCLKEWYYNDQKFTGCASDVEGRPDDWCYVADPQDCKAKGGTAEGEDSLQVWDTCGASACQCKESWHYHGMDFEGCAKTDDSNDEWCFVQGPRQVCLNDGAQDANSTGYEGELWKTCRLGEISKHGCHCKFDWSYGGQNYQGCAWTKDHKRPWCEVTDGAECDGSINTHKDGVYWDDCAGDEPVTDTFNGCSCQKTWTYHGHELSGCSMTDDFEHSWCYVEEKESCLEMGGKNSNSTPGEVWDYCYLGDATIHHCICEETWKYGGLTLSGCNGTQSDPYHWCYVKEPCEGAVRTHKTGDYWDKCDMAQVLKEREFMRNMSAVGKTQLLLMGESADPGRISDPERMSWAPSYLPWEATLAAQMNADTPRHRKPPPPKPLHGIRPLQEWGKTVDKAVDVAKPLQKPPPAGLVQAAAWAYVA